MLAALLHCELPASAQIKDPESKSSIFSSSVYALDSFESMMVEYVSYILYDKSSIGTPVQIYSSSKFCNSESFDKNIEYISRFIQSGYIGNAADREKICRIFDVHDKKFLIGGVRLFSNLSCGFLIYHAASAEVESMLRRRLFILNISEQYTSRNEIVLFEELKRQFQLGLIICAIESDGTIRLAWRN
jgi:hypothetical protein